MYFAISGIRPLLMCLCALSSVGIVDSLNKNNFKDINQVYDFIRMLDAEGYPSAFVNSKNLNIKFKNAKLNKNILKADVEIELYK